MSNTLIWHEQGELLGVRVRAWFFDPAQAAVLADPVAQLLPLLVNPMPRPVAPLGQRRSYAVGSLVGQPDAVLAHGDGLLCLLHKGGDGRALEPGTWLSQLRVDVMLQAIGHAMAVSGSQQLPTVALWRGLNLVCQFDPSPPVLECLATHIGAARHYWNEPVQVSPAQLASFCEPRLRVLPGVSQGDAASLAA